MTSPPAQGREILRVQHRLPRAGSYVCSANYTGVFSRLEFFPEGKAMMPGRRVIEPVGSCLTYFLLSLWTCWPCGPRLWQGAPFGASCPIPTDIRRQTRPRSEDACDTFTLPLAYWPSGQMPVWFYHAPRTLGTNHLPLQRTACMSTDYRPRVFPARLGPIGPLPPGEGEPVYPPVETGGRSVALLELYSII